MHNKKIYDKKYIKLKIICLNFTNLNKCIIC